MITPWLEIPFKFDFVWLINFHTLRNQVNQAKVIKTDKAMYFSSMTT